MTDKHLRGWLELPEFCTDALMVTSVVDNSKYKLTVITHGSRMDTTSVPYEVVRQLLYEALDERKTGGVMNYVRRLRCNAGKCVSKVSLSLQRRLRGLRRRLR